MKRGLIALAVAGAFAAPAAMADVTISGAINMGLQIGKSSDAPANTFSGTPAVPGLTTNQLHPSYSHIDIESTDDIGNGNKIVFHYQFDISGTSSAAPNLAGGAIGNRNSFIGVVGTWGAFKVGTNENVYERFMYVPDPLDGAVGPGGNLNILGTPGVGTVFEVGQAGCATLGAAFVFDPDTGTNIANPDAGTGGCVGFYRRAEQQIWYESPNWNGFTFEVDYTLSAFKTQTIDPQIISIGGKWQPEGMPFYVDLAIEQHEDMFGANKLGAVGGTGSSDDALQIGGGWTLGDLSLHARYEQLSYKTDGIAAGLISEYERDAYWFAVKYNMPSGYVGAELGIANEGETNLGDAVDTGATMFGVGYFHNLSKQSQLQFIYARTDNDANGSYAQIGSPLAGGGPSTSIGADHQVFDVRIKHTF
ncbi:MAG TPA: porin [Burkholderiales bacterium]|jgi:predicted porin|nr:porin [Burkholderiales bacterium]